MFFIMVCSLYTVVHCIQYKTKDHIASHMFPCIEQRTQPGNGIMGIRKFTVIYVQLRNSH